MTIFYMWTAYKSQIEIKKIIIKSYTDLFKIYSPYYFDLQISKKGIFFFFAINVKEICHIRLEFVVNQIEWKKLIKGTNYKIT